MKSLATTVKDYLAELPPDRRAALEAVRKVILANLDRDFEEGMQYGMIGYYVPHRVYPAGYHCDPKQPFPFAGLASQKNHMSFYLMCAYGNPDAEKKFRQAWEKTGRKLDMGKSCVRFKRLEDVALDVVAATIRAVKAREYVSSFVKAIEQSRKNSKPAARPATKATGKAAASARKRKGGRS